jgi:putative nucleotidyltransferase-like protein
MSDARLKRGVLAALRREPDTVKLKLLPRVQSKSGYQLLRWLDQSGLSLLFLNRLEACEPTHSLSEWVGALRPRLAGNTERVRDMLAEFQRINTAFQIRGITAAALKGFTLLPDFCDDPTLRHQSDFDFLVAPGDLRNAADALRHCGYSTAQINESGETCFTTPLRHIPTAQDDIYSVPRHRQVDLHVSIWEECSWFPVEYPTDCLEHVRPGSYAGISYLGLSLEDKFLMQVFHAFRHSFRSWVRLSWIREIGHFLELHAENDALWHRGIARAGTSHLTKLVFAFVLGLTNRLFASPIPAPMQSWTADAMPFSLRVWLDHFAVEWAVADWPGSLNNLFLTEEFIPDRTQRLAYVRGRLLPKSSSTSIGSVAVNSGGMFFKLQATRLRYVTRRAAVHLKDIFRLPMQQVRWKRALQASRRSILDHNY